MNRPVQLHLQLSPCSERMELPAEVAQQLVQEVAELLLQVQRAEDECPAALAIAGETEHE